MNVMWAPLAALDPADSLSIIQWAMWWLLVLWLLCVGGCFGSFMNVVIYRLPAGLSLTRPASRCPLCLHPIRGRDNIPVIGWLLLRGRCRDCQTRIPPRYPLIEGVVAVGCLVLALAEVFPGGHGLPEPVRLDLHANPWQLWTMFSAHLLLLCTLFCAVMIQYDGHAIPWRLFVPLVLVAFGLAVLVPEACRIRWSVSPPGTWAGNLIQSLMAAGCGGFAGATLAAFTRESERIPRGSMGLGLFVALITLLVGWISGLLIAVLSGLLTLFQERLARRWPAWGDVPTLAWTSIVTFCLLVSWRWLLPHFPVLALDSASSFAVATIVALLLISATAWWLGPWSPLYWSLGRTEADSDGDGDDVDSHPGDRRSNDGAAPYEPGTDDDEPLEGAVHRREVTRVKTERRREASENSDEAEERHNH